MLFDAVYEYCIQLDKYCDEENVKNVEIHNCCIYDYDGDVDVYKNGEASMIKGIDGPNLDKNGNLRDLNLNKEKAGFNNIISRKCFKFNNFDRGDIDVLFLDTEGSEWFTLKHMISLPTLIAIEMRMHNYINPFAEEIFKWMEKNKYMILKDNGSDVIFLRKNLINLVEENKYELNFLLDTFGL